MRPTDAMWDAAAQHLLRDARFAEAAELLDDTVDGDATAHRELAALWLGRLGRIDRALFHYRRAWERARDRRAVAELRKLHASLGQDAAVAQLLEEELIETEDDARAAALLFELGRVAARSGALEEAARRFEQSLARAPEAEDGHAAREALAEVLAGLPDEAQAARAVELCLELAAEHRARGDIDGAATYLRRGLGVDPESPALLDALAALLRDAERWGELDKLYAARGMVAERAEILDKKLGDREQAKRCWEALGPAGTAPLRALYAADGNWDKLAALTEQGLAERTPAERATELLGLATLARDKLADRERAARYLRRLLEEQPGHEEARRRLVEHLRERRDWRGLADLLARDAARAAGADKLKRLEELAETCEQRLGDVERATAAWHEVAALDPARGAAREALRRLGARSKMWESLIGVLEKEAAAAATPTEKADALRRMAGVFRERQVDPLRAIALFEEALALAPGDAATLKALGELYERQGDDAGLLRTLRRQLEATAVKPAKLTASARIERLALLRRVAALAEARGDTDHAVYACTAILELAPGERDALERLERVLERAGDAAGLEAALAYRAEAAGGPSERARALRRLARIADERGDPLAAMERWERLLAAQPTDVEALRALAKHYEAAGRARELAAVLERLCDAPRAGRDDDEAARAIERRRYARVVDELLDDAPRAAKAWRRVLEAQPRDRGALAALARRLEKLGAWRELVEILARQIAVVAVDDPAAAAALARRRAAVLESELAAPREAAGALAELIATLAPTDLDAHARLARLRLADGDVEGAVRALERLAFLAPAVEQKIAALVQISELAAEKLEDPRRALQAIERALELAPRDPVRLAAAAKLYAEVGAWTHHVATLERLAALEEPAVRQLTLLALADVVEERLGDARQAFRWRRRAHDIDRGAWTLGALRTAAERNALWPELIEVLEGERRAARGDAARFVALTREISSVCERAGEPLRAIAVLGEAVAATPEDDSLHGETERVAAASGDPAAWRAVLSVTQAALHARLGPVRARLHERRARVLDERLGEPAAALDELLAAFKLAPRAEARPAIAALAARTRRWEELLRVDGALYKLETAAPGKVAVLRRAAKIVEEQLGNPLRAFRGLLRALRRAPEDLEVRAELWRLAGLVGSYGDAPAAPPPDAARSLEPLFVIEEALEAAPRDRTIQLSLEDVLGDLDARERTDATIQLSLDDVLPARPAAQSAPPPPPRAARSPAPPGFTSAWEELAAAYEALRPADNLARARALASAAEVWDRGAGDVTRAIDALLRARAAAGQAPLARELGERLHALAAERDAWDELGDQLVRAGERAESAAAAAALLHEGAAVRVAHGRGAEAEGLYRRLLGLRPDDDAARAGLETLYRAERRWSELAAIYEERVDPRLGAAVPEAERPPLLAELARIYDVELSRPYEAIDALERLCALAPANAEAHERLAAMYEKVGRWARAVDTLGKVAELEGASSRGRAARGRMARIYEEELELPDRARAVRAGIS